MKRILFFLLSVLLITTAQGQISKYTRSAGHYIYNSDSTMVNAMSTYQNGIYAGVNGLRFISDVNDYSFSELLGGGLPSYTSGQILYGDGSSTPTSSSNLIYSSGILTLIKSVEAFNIRNNLNSTYTQLSVSSGTTDAVKGAFISGYTANEVSIGSITNSEFQVRVNNTPEARFNGTTVDFEGNQIKDVADPTDAQDVVTLNYFNTNSAISGLTTNRVTFATSATDIGDDGGLTYNSTNNILTVGFAGISTFHPSTNQTNLFIGRSSGNTSLTGATIGFNTALGYSSLFALTSGSANTAIGSQALDAVTTGSGNTAIGSALGSLTTGNNNIGLGNDAGQNLTTGSNNFAVGDVDLPSATANGQMSIQNAIFGLSNTQTGTTVSTGDIGIYQPAPSYHLHVTGNAADQTLFLVEENGGSDALSISEVAGVIRIAMPNLPTSSAGLPTGTLWNDSGTLKIAP